MNDLVKEGLKKLEEAIIPTKPLQWQTFLLVALLLLLGSILVSLGNGGDRQLSEILGSLSWLFLTIGIGWLTAEKLAIGNFSPSPWIVGAMICVFFYENVAGDIKPFIVIMWPLISLSIGTLALFLKQGGKLEKSPPLVTKSFTFLFLINLLLSCWLSFHFFLQGWIGEYPSLLEGDLSKSAFIAKVRQSSINQSRGATILDIMEQKLREETGDRQLETSVEQMKLKLITLKFKALEELPPAKENKYWFLETPMIASNSGYQIELQLIWEGPTAGGESYYLSKSCEIQRQVFTPESGETPNAQAPSQEVPKIVNILECEPVRRIGLKPEQVL
ncbi:MAG: DUF5357 domain-containing protein [Okeania sp. SIO2H7]|nr:DUF5357 domain-containing protein [Okeania sp. SIO2H7]